MTYFYRLKFLSIIAWLNSLVNDFLAMMTLKNLRVLLAYYHSWRIRALLKSAKVIALWIASGIWHCSSFITCKNTWIQILILRGIYSIVIHEWFVDSTILMVIVSIKICVCLGVVVFRVERLVNFHIFKIEL